MTNASAKDWVDRLLEDVADDLADSYIADQGYEQAEFPNLSRVADKLLKNRLRPLLLAGQALSTWQNECTRYIGKDAWDAAVKAANESK